MTKYAYEIFFKSLNKTWSYDENYRGTFFLTDPIFLRENVKIYILLFVLSFRPYIRFSKIVIVIFYLT